MARALHPHPRDAAGAPERGLASLLVPLAAELALGEGRPVAVAEL